MAHPGQTADKVVAAARQLGCDRCMHFFFATLFSAMISREKRRGMVTVPLRQEFAAACEGRVGFCE